MEGVVVPHLGRAARNARKAAEVKLIRIAYVLDRAEATLSRFERGEVQPADVDAVVLAYARELEINPLALWADALDLARTEGVSDKLDEVNGHDESAAFLPGPLPGVSGPPTTEPAHDEGESGGGGSGRETG